MRSKVYVGHTINGSMEIFRSLTIPTESSYGHTYSHVIGPFRTVRGARFMATYGKNNPHCRCVKEAERLALRYAAGEAVKKILGE